MHTGGAGFWGPTPITFLAWGCYAWERALGCEGVLWGLRWEEEWEEKQMQKSLEEVSPSNTTEPAPAGCLPQPKGKDTLTAENIYTYLQATVQTSSKPNDS